MNEGSLYKKHGNKITIDKTASTPENCKIINDNIENMNVPSWLDYQWYIEKKKKRIYDFIG